MTPDQSSTTEFQTMACSDADLGRPTRHPACKHVQFEIVRLTAEVMNAEPVPPSVDPPLMTDLERSQAAEIERLKADNALKEAFADKVTRDCIEQDDEIQMLRSQIDNCHANSHYRAWQESQKELARAQQLMADAFKQRDQYLLELQKTRQTIADMETISAAAIPRLQALSAVVEKALKWRDARFPPPAGPGYFKAAPQELALYQSLHALDATEPYRNVLHTHQSGAHASTSSESVLDRGLADG